MSAAAPAVSPVGTMSLWRGQALSILGMELRRNFISKRGFWIYGLALVPVIIVWVHSIFTMRGAPRMSHDLSKDTQVLASLFQLFLLRPAIFFGCLGIFTYLFRGEFVERSLHYYFLAPVRREVLVVAKYCAGSITAISFFGLSVFLTFAGMYAHYPQFEVRQWLLNGPGLGHLGAYLAITTLACLAWGSVFLWMGIRFKNPIVPAVVFLTWESANVLLPSWLRRLNILHFLQSLNPVNVQNQGPGSLLGTTAEPEHAVTAVLCLILISAAMVFLSIRELKRAEVNYSTE
ncbi:MAG: ABC transporter permease [Bryobacteraceae bacterium]|nr:ABC transporter permease [Bryobacteraceae bacterium]